MNFLFILLFYYQCKDPTNADQYKNDKIGLSFRKSSIMVHKVYFCQTTNVTDVQGSDDDKIWNIDENRVDMIGYSASEIIKGSKFRAFTICVERYLGFSVLLGQLQYKEMNLN